MLGSCIELSGIPVGVPVPGQQFPQSVLWHVGDAGEHVGELGLGVDIVSLAETMRVYMNAARRAPRSEPANNHAFLPRAIPRRARSAALLERQMRPSSRNAVKPGHRASM
jgi:hypothetical protein